MAPKDEFYDASYRAAQTEAREWSEDAVCRVIQTWWGRQASRTPSMASTAAGIVDGFTDLLRERAAGKARMLR